MSDPSANVDIEDVLSSIRRLVSNGPDKVDERLSEVREAERLVLTPSQRVDEAENARKAEDAGSPHSGAAGVTEAHPPEADQSLEPEPDSAGCRDGDAAVREAADTAAAIGADVEVETGPGPESGSGSETAPSAVSTEPADPDSGTEEYDWADMDATGSWKVKPVTATEFRAAVGADETEDDSALDGIAAMFARHETATPSSWEPDGDDEDAFADGASSPTLDWRDVDQTDEPDEDKSQEMEDADGYEPEAPEDYEPEAPGSYGSESSDAHDPGAEALGDNEPEASRAESFDAGGARDERQGYAIDWGAMNAGTGEAEDNAFAGEDEAVLDEEALRDLVAEIVREELMGTLGERITRNVRKLVRREIHRALNSQDFD